MRRTSVAIVVCAFSATFAGSVVSHRLAQAKDNSREAVALNRVEAEELLAGMRTYLETIQDIVAALAENKIARVPEIAAKSGNKMLGGINPMTGFKLPVGFTMMSLDTHDKFDKLAEKAARSVSRTEVLTDLGVILNNCSGCHAVYKLAR